MRVSQKEMEKSHRRIVDGASRLIRERGIEGTSVADVMGEAGLKQGGFYRHFDSKDALVEAALQDAFEQMLLPLETRLEKQEPKAAIAEYRSHYLSQGHVEQRGFGCPVAALGSDVARGLSALKTSFGAGVNRMVKALAAGMRGSPQEIETSAARDLAMMVGAVVIARASDPETARKILSACQNTSKDA
jgi:TetR/AcrR family transcriptional repressor of nem operon